MDTKQREEQMIIELARASHGLPHAPITLDGLDLTKLWELADRHRVLPSVYHAARPMAREKDFAEPLGRIRTHILRQVALRRLSQRIAEEMARESVRFLVVKGQAIEGCYGRVLRPSFDLDLLIDPESLARAVPAMERIGMKRSPKPQSDGLHLTSGSLEVDLHTRLMARHFPALPDTSALFERSKELNSGLRTLSDEDQLTFLIAHGFKHQWCRLVWILDLALFAKSVGQPTVESAIATAQSHGLGRAAEVALALASTLLGFPSDRLSSHTPHSPLRRLLYPVLYPVRGYFPPPKLAARYEKRLFESGVLFHSKIESLALHLVSLERRLDGVRYLAGRMAHKVAKITGA